MLMYIFLWPGLILTHGFFNRKTKREATTKSMVPSSTASLLSIITSTATPASSSASIPTATSFPPTSQTPADESFAENNSK